MTKNYFTEVANYNIWANDIVIGWLNNISDEQWEKYIESSFNSIADTVLHVTGAEQIWLDRLNHVAAPVWLPSVFKGTRKEMIEIWQKASEGLKKSVEEIHEEAMNELLSFKRINGEQYHMQYYHVYAHVFNHSTYHRGQLVTMLRQAGFKNVGSTDMLGFFKK